MSADETNQVGKITKQWMGLMELFTDADNFSVTCKSFPSINTAHPVLVEHNVYTVHWFIVRYLQEW